MTDAVEKTVQPFPACTDHGALRRLFDREGLSEQQLQVLRLGAGQHDTFPPEE